jgi:hypothetical protein
MSRASLVNVGILRNKAVPFHMPLFVPIPSLLPTRQNRLPSAIVSKSAVVPSVERYALPSFSHLVQARS